VFSTGFSLSERALGVRFLSFIFRLLAFSGLCFLFLLRFCYKEIVENTQSVRWFFLFLSDDGGLLVLYI
jgi:hypothetical protein